MGSTSVFSEPLKYVGLSEPGEIVKNFEIDPTDGLIGGDGRDFTLTLRSCSSASKFFCFVAINKGIVFAMPKERGRLEESWSFSGYDFSVLGKKNMNSDTVYIIRAKIKQEFIGYKDYTGSHRQEIDYFFSEKKGLNAWIFKEMKISCKTIDRENWVNINPPKNFLNWIGGLPTYTAFSELDVMALSKKNLNFDEFVEVYTGRSKSK